MAPRTQSLVPSCMKRVLRLSEMDRVNRSFQNCYICGASLANGEPCQREHVVPKSLLGPPPKADADRWPVILPAHRQCDVLRKRRGDVLARSVIRGHHLGAASLPQQDLAEFYKHLKIEPRFAGDVHGRPAISGIGPVLDSMELWARGMYATTYGVLLPSDAACIVIPPVPCGISSSSAEGSASFTHNAEIAAQGVEDVITACDALDCWDGVKAWGQTLTFQCVWMKANAVQGDTAARCVWRLDFFGVRTWSETVCLVPRPLTGWFETNEMPSGCAVLPAGAFSHASSIRAERHPYLTMWPLPSCSIDVPQFRRRAP